MHWICFSAMLMLCGVSCQYSQFFEHYHHTASVFAELSPTEMRAVSSFLLAQKNLNLSAATSHTLHKNYIFLIELQIPKKQHILNFLNGIGCAPRRNAKAIIFFGAGPKPNVTEYIVGPLPIPKYFHPARLRSKQPIKFTSRPTTYVEIALIHEKLQEVTKTATLFLKETSGFWYHNCTDRCLTFTDVAPRGLRSGDRKSWFILQQGKEGFFIHPIGLEILLNHKSVDPRHWAVEKVWYNGQYFDSMEELVRKYNMGLVNIFKLPEHPSEDVFSTYIPRGHFKTRTDIPGPKQYEGQGKRYKVKGNSVLYAGWSFAYRMRTSTGLQLFNVRFNDEPIAFEISVQEALAFYSGHSPAGMQTKYIDTAWGMGTFDYELAKGIDCPEIATYKDAYHFRDTDQPVRYKNALCIFEHSTAVPLRRHFSSNFQGSFKFYGGLENHVLVIRTISTVYNYDYIWDFIFHQNGVIEVKVHATGYIHSTFFTPEGENYGTKVYDYVLGNLHTHLIHYKVDLDVAGTENSFETIGLKFENISNPWSPGDYVVQSKLERVQRVRERAAAFPFTKPSPRYLLFYNPQKKNKWQSHRAYRIQFNSQADRLLPRDWKEEKAITWSRYRLAVTRFREREECSSDMFLQNDPWDPNVRFENFIQNNENITNQDLVAWVTVGFLHIPHSEDVPNTSTPGNAVGFFLRPFNFFQEDPSVSSRSVVIVRPEGKSFSSVKIQTWQNATGDYCLKQTPFRYNGTYLPD
ncbi:amiloride-sensitive amine oxidase [copper-containing] [Carcharodon carcharias]|uniref:amiloride-sensitive amine oxidase [copper-containing] n=1 Tax=Carcharodon carcharias TaxID=13397 RepID=UPI001B7F0675|nr:amiloride-sensitive amine oxidase [copper-containing] [Carcharodon carcharias]